MSKATESRRDLTGDDAHTGETITAREAKPSVVIVENDSSIRSLLMAMLQPDFEVTAFASGDDFLRSLPASTGNVFIIGSPVYVDVGVHRRRVLEELVWKRLDRVLERTIIVTTRVTEADLLSRASAARVFAVVAKPFDGPNLIELVGRCVAGRVEPATTIWVGIAAPERFEVGRKREKQENRRNGEGTE